MSEFYKQIYDHQEFKQKEFNKTSFVESVFSHCLFEHCFFQENDFCSDLKMKRMSFRGSKVQECCFSNTLLAEADFRETDLEGSLFHHTDLAKADFRDAKNYSIDPTSNVIKKARFSSLEALRLLKFSDILIS